MTDIGWINPMIYCIYLYTWELSLTKSNHLVTSWQLIYRTSKDANQWELSSSEPHFLHTCTSSFHPAEGATGEQETSQSFWLCSVLAGPLCVAKHRGRAQMYGFTMSWRKDGPAPFAAQLANTIVLNRTGPGTGSQSWWKLTSLDAAFHSAVVWADVLSWWTCKEQVVAAKLVIKVRWLSRVKLESAL